MDSCVRLPQKGIQRVHFVFSHLRCPIARNKTCNVLFWRRMKSPSLGEKAYISAGNAAESLGWVRIHPLWLLSSTRRLFCPFSEDLSRRLLRRRLRCRRHHRERSGSTLKLRTDLNCLDIRDCLEGHWPRHWRRSTMSIYSLQASANLR
jgi:hypothetical protein